MNYPMAFVVDYPKSWPVMKIYPTKKTFRITIIPVINQARVFIQSGLANSPILLLLLVNNTKGITAKGS